MSRPSYLAVPIAALFAWLAVGTIVDLGDIWLGSLLLSTAVFFLLIPALFPARDRAPSTTNVPAADPAPTVALDTAPAIGAEG